MKTIIVTGANGDLGAATVRKLLEEDYKVIAVDSDNKHLDFAFNNAYFGFHAVNLTDEKETVDFINSAIARYGIIDAAVMLVGGFAIGRMEDTATADLIK